VIEVELNTKDFEKAMRIIPGQLKMELGDAFDHIGRKFLKTFRDTRLSGRPGLKKHPHSIYKYFKRADIVAQNIEGMGTTIFTESKTAKKHEEGGQFSNPRGGMLAIPLSERREMFTADDRLRGQYKNPGLMRNIIKIRLSGRMFLARVKRRSREILPLFVLKGSIKVVPRLGFYATWESMANVNMQILNDAIDKALKKV
jgi:hypothetical protein